MGACKVIFGCFLLGCCMAAFVSPIVILIAWVF